MNKYLLHWRLLVLAIMTSLLLTETISSEAFLVMIVGIILFVVIPEGANALMNKYRKESS